MTREYEVIIIGGGITGATIARDCSMRGFRTLLLEKKDFGAGTTGACTGMIHGGMQYVLSEFEMTEMSCIESGIFQREAPHLVFRIPFLHPFFHDPSDAGMFGPVFEKYDQVGVHKNSHSHVTLTAKEALTLEPALSPKIQGALTSDEPGIDTFRLTMVNILAAAEHGATIRNHTQVLDILREGKRVYGVRVRDTLTGEVEDYYSTFVVNAAGPWTPQVAALAEVFFKLRPIKGSHLVFDRRITSNGVGSPAGASLIPHENGAICGIANAFYFQNPDEVVANPNEAEELLSAMEVTVPSIRQARIIRTYSGVRPTLPDEKSKDQRAVSRNFQVFDHEELEGLTGFITIAGGKMVIARRMAETLTDLLCKKMGRDEPCRTADEPLPGGEAQVDPAALADEFGVPLHAVVRMVHRHGARAVNILEECQTKPQYKNHVCVCEPVLEAEIRYSIRHEWVRTLDDLRRRNRMAMGPCQGMHCTAAAEGVLSDELDRPAGQAHRDVLDFLQKRWRGRHPALSGIQLRQEELLRASYLNVGNYQNPDLEEDEPMVKKTDVLVIGGGMAGAMAAITAARFGLNTLLLRQGYGATALSSGAVDLAGAAGWLRRIQGADGPAESIVEAAAGAFTNLMAEAGYPHVGNLHESMILANSIGTMKQTHIVPTTMAAGNLKSLDNARILFVGVRGYGDFDAGYISKSIQFFTANRLIFTPIETGWVEIEFPKVKHTANTNAFELARLLEREGVAIELAERIAHETSLDHYTHIAFPSILGVDHPQETLSVLQDWLGLPCFETLALPPSVPGYRLQKALDAEMKSAGVQVIYAAVKGFSAKDGRVERIYAVDKEARLEVEPACVILASGKFISGGVQWNGRLKEPIFDLPVSIDGNFDIPAGMSAQITDQFVSEQRVFTAGLKVDERFRPIAPDKRFVYSNLMAAGSLITGYNYSQGDAGLGVPLVSGYLCGKIAREMIVGEGALA